MAVPLKTRRTFLLFTLVAALSFALHGSLAQFAYDDAFIHLRIARNWVQFGSPYFNTKEPVMGTSSPVWTALLAVMYCARIPMLVGVTTANSIFFTAAVLEWEFLIRYFTGIRTYLLTTVSIVTLMAILLPSSVGLMETPLVVFLLGLGIDHLVQKKRSAFLWLTLACATRPELALFYFAALLWNYRARLVTFTSVVISSCAVAVPILITCFYYYGTVIPHPIAAKHVVYQPSRSEWVYVLMEALFGDSAVRNQHTELVAYLCVCFLLAGVAVAKLSNEKIVRLAKTPVFVLAVVPALVLLTMYGVTNALVFPWYAPLFALPLASGLVVLTARKSMLYRIGTILVLVPFVTVGARDAYAAFTEPAKFRNAESSMRVHQYLRLATDLSLRCPDCTLLGPEIGALGYGFTGKVIDAEGLVSPEAMQWHPMKIGTERASGVLGAVPPELVRTAKPDVIIGIGSLMKALLASPVVDDYRREEISRSVRIATGDGKSFWQKATLEVLIKKDRSQLNGWPGAYTQDAPAKP